LTALAADENAIYQRKQNVRRFGAGWIRPPGVAKTLQALKDEELEKEEQEAMARREQIMMDLAAAQQDAANAEARMHGEEGDMDDDDDEENGGEHDLDDDVPEAVNSSDESASASSSDSDSDSDSDNEGSVSAASPDARGSESIPFNEDSFIEGSQLEAEVSAMLDHEEAEMAGVLQDERDLDDDVPEAGSYEHTDSELDDSDSSAGDISLVTPAGRHSVRSRRESRRSLGWSSARRSTQRSTGRRSSGLPSAPPSTQRSVHMHAPTRSVGRVLDLGPSLGNGRSSFGFDGSSSLMEGSSFLRSSPAAAAAAPRGSLRDRFLGVARGAAGRR
jgi:hypothetical protein